MLEFWRAGGPGSLVPGRAAREAEAEGWDGQAFMDSQSLGADPYVLMAHWAAATERLKLATGVTNPLTRHPVVTASAAATIQATSGSRFVLGIGRGDSALAYLGYAPTSISRFERALTDLQTLLSGGEVAFAHDPLAEQVESLGTLSLGDRPSAARLGWLPPDLPKVPLDVAATGPRVIELGARLAERLTFSVGAERDRVKWALDCANRARVADERDAPISYGVQVVVVCHQDVDSVREIATRLVMPLARFQVIQGRAAGPTRAGDDEAYAAISRGYAMTKHSRFDENKLVGAVVDFDFVRRFAIVGTADECSARLIELARLGIERFVVFGPGVYEDGSHGVSLFAKEVMPAVRAAVGDPR